MADITSYDYDAVMDEAGDPTEKYHKVREVIAQHLPMSSVPVPERAPKMTLPSVLMTPIGTLLSEKGRQYLGRTDDGSSSVRTATDPLTFEQLNQFSGIVLYETTMPRMDRDPAELTINGLRDRALIFIEGLYVGTLSRENAIYKIPMTAGWGTRLQILVENQGRINFNDTNDHKGILGSVYMQTFNEDLRLNNWTMTGFPLTNYAHIEEFVADPEERVVVSNRGMLYNGPTVLHANFDIPAGQTLYDTYLDTTGWGKVSVDCGVLFQMFSNVRIFCQGFVYINGFHLGRYWPLMGPQITMYVPKDILRNGSNTIVIVDYQRATIDRTIKFTDTPSLDGVVV